MTSAYVRFVQGLAEGVYQPLQYVAQTQPGLLPDEYAEAYEDNSESIVETLLLKCNASSAAPKLIAESFAASGGKPPAPRVVIDASHPYLPHHLRVSRALIGLVADLLCFVLMAGIVMHDISACNCSTLDYTMHLHLAHKAAVP